MKVSQRDLIDAVEEAMQHDCEDFDSALRSGAKTIVNFMKRDTCEIEKFKRLVMAYLSNDNEIEIV